MLLFCAGFADAGVLETAKALDNMTYVTVMYANGITGKDCRTNLSDIDTR